MDIIAINDAIEDLEQGDTTLDTVQELASLYIVAERLGKSILRQSRASDSTVEDELNDILPSYEQYKEIKRKYQLNEATSEGVVHKLRLVCREIEDLVGVLYSGTDFPKERSEIITMLNNITSNLSN